MPSIRSLLASSLLLLPILAHAALDKRQAQREQQSKAAEAQADFEAFQRLLEQVDPPALHAALHNFTPKKFKHGVFKEDRTAVEAVHKDDPPLASTIVVVAKRQDAGAGNATTTVVTTIITTVPPTTTEIVVATSPTTPGSTPTQPASTLETATSAKSPPSQTPSVSAPAGSSPSIPVVASPTNPPVVISTNPTGKVTSIPPVGGDTLTTTNAAGVTIITTINGGVITLLPGGGSSPTEASGSGSGAGSDNSNSIVSPTVKPSTKVITIQTSTLTDGGLVTLTRVTVVQPTANSQPPTGVAGSAVSTTGVAGSLQSGHATRSRHFGWEAVGVLGGAVGFAMVL